MYLSLLPTLLSGFSGISGAMVNNANTPGFWTQLFGGLLGKGLGGLVGGLSGGLGNLLGLGGSRGATTYSTGSHPNF